jgi:hypothetical protein
MRPIDAVLRLRPTNAANRLGPGSKTCLLSARDIQRALASRPGPVVCFALPSDVLAPMAQGVLRAARQLDAAVGLGAEVHGLGEGPRPWAAFQDLATAAAEVGIRQPLFLRGGPVVLAGASAQEVARAGESVFQLVDAGFTEVALDASALEEGGAAAAALREVAALARERELGIDLLAPAGGAARVAGWLRELSQRGFRPDVVTAPGGGAGAEELRALEQAAAPSTLGLIDEPCAGARAPRVVLARRLQALVESRPRSVEWLEAHAYCEASEALLAAGCEGSGTAAVRFLAERGGVA